VDGILADHLGTPTSGNRWCSLVIGKQNPIFNGDWRGFRAYLCARFHMRFLDGANCDPRETLVRVHRIAEVGKLLAFPWCGGWHVLQINVNGASREGRSRPENWGELLDLLEQGDGLSRQIVTAVRFGGVAVPTFREATELARDLDDVDRIDIETTTLSELLHESAQAAYDSIAPLRKAVARIAAKLRAGHSRAAVRDLPALTGSIQTLTNVTAMLGAARESVGSHRSDFDGLVSRLCGVIDAIIERQARQEWPAVADVLDVELAPTLAAWSSVVRRVWTV